MWFQLVVALKFSQIGAKILNASLCAIRISVHFMHALKFCWYMCLCHFLCTLLITGIRVLLVFSIQFELYWSQSQIPPLVREKGLITLWPFTLFDISKIRVFNFIYAHTLYSMKSVGLIFWLSEKAKEFQVVLEERYELPTYAVFIVIALATIVVGLALGGVSITAYTV